MNALSHATSIDLGRHSGARIDRGSGPTNFSKIRFRGNEERAAKDYRGITPLAPADAAEAVLWVVDRPPHVNVRDIVLMPTAQRNAYVVHKEES